MTRPDPRELLLDGILVHARTHGLADTSLRALAAAVGTSHRMLIYHFGSREGLLAAVVARVEAEQRAGMAALAQAADQDPATLFRTMWAGLADPAMHESERLFFEVAAMALRGRPGTGTLLESLVEPWLAQGEAAARALGLPVEPARTQARIGVALLRGLLLDLLATGDRAGTDAAVEAFLASWP